MSQALPARASLEFLKKLAKDRLRALRAGRANARLADAQLVVAREHGFSSWRSLKARVDAQTKAIVTALAAPYEDPFVAALPERRRTHKIAQWKPLMDAAFAGDADRVRRLIDAGADPNVISTTPARMRPLHRVIERKKTAPRGPAHDAALKALLDRGADPRLRATMTQVDALQLAGMDEPRFTRILRKHFDALDVFHAAVLAEDRRVDRLLAADPSLARARDANGWTALHYCAASALFKDECGQGDALLRIARRLIDAGADVNATFLFEGKWPIPVLYYSSGYHDHAAMTELLLDAGADPCDDESIYHAADEGHEHCLAVFERRVSQKTLAAECTKVLPVLLGWGHTRGVPWLLAHGADPNYVRPETGESALHIAAKRPGGKKMVKLLLRYGADPRIATRSGATACLVASRAKAWESLTLLEGAVKPPAATARRRRPSRARARR